MAISFGIFDWIDRRPTPLGQLYEERLQLLEAADGADFFCYHIAEHHGTPLGMAPSPSVFLAQRRSARDASASVRWCISCRCTRRCV